MTGAPSRTARVSAARRNLKEAEGKLLVRGTRTAWASYFRKAEVRDVFEELDQWIRRKLRAILWRQWKRNWTPARELNRRGIAHNRAWLSATNGRGPWWNAGASHMNQAVLTRYLSQLGLPSLLQELQRLAIST